ncbi:MAG: hypothetical protein KAH17_09705 [Bacteroidales bacterium]|nr:hypothetical protein [Bacteroidales bacterium]
MRKKPASFSGIFLIIMALAPMLGYSQPAKPISSKAVFDHFDHLHKVDARLVSGDFYQTPFMNKLAGHPYFFDSEWKSGYVVLDSIKYDKLLIRYDIHTNQLILNTVNITDSYLQLVLKKEDISLFYMDKHLFRPYPIVQSQTGVQFCEVLSTGKIDFLLLKSKRLKVTPGGPSDYIYQSRLIKSLQLNGEIIPYRGRRTLYKLFPEHKSQIRNFIQEERMAYRRINLEGHIKLIDYCNTLLSVK